MDHICNLGLQECKSCSSFRSKVNNVLDSVLAIHMWLNLDLLMTKIFYVFFGLKNYGVNQKSYFYIIN